MIITATDLLPKVKNLLHVDDVDDYDTELTLFIETSMDLLDREGVRRPDIDLDSDWVSTYTTLVFINTARLWELDVEDSRLEKIYLKTVVTLRTRLENEV